MDLQKKEQIEIDYWKTSEFENPDRFTEENYQNKMGDARVFKDLLNTYHHYFENAEAILEVGAGQGWASCIVKQRFPDKELIVTDISPFAVESLKYWEERLGVRINHRFAAKSYCLPVKSSSIDLIFCFSSAHHFVLFNDTLKEVQRVLKESGTCIWFCEPSSPKFFYKMVKKRLNRIRQIVPEDVLVLRELKFLASRNNLGFQVKFYPSTIKRGKWEGYYFRILKWLPFLNHLLPASVNVIFRKK